MANNVERIEQVPLMLTSERAIALVSVPWSPGPVLSRRVLAALESNQEQWLPGVLVAFFDLWPEREEALLAWYEEQCRLHWPRFELHGHGWGPLWWLVRGQ